MKILIAAIALTIAFPAAAQTAPAADPHAAHQMGGHEDHKMDGQAMDDHKMDCCADKDGNGKMDCCDKAADGKADDCCAKHEKHDMADHQGHDMSKH